jgi:pyruvate/2-oxoglutarate/acetoin dehydrogenase E1 component
VRTIKYRTAIVEAMNEEMARDERVFVIGEDVDVLGGVFKLTRGLLEKYGARRVRGTPISEAAFIGLATGAAMTGLRPIVEIMYQDFALVGMDQLVNQACSICSMSGGRVRVPIVFRGQVGTGSREAAQHSRQFESWFVNTPGIKVVMPSDARDAKGLLKSAIRDDNPVLFLENRMLFNSSAEVPDGEWLVPIGLSEVKRPGRDLTVVATGGAVRKSLAAAASLQGRFDIEVIDPRTLSPLDMDTIMASVGKTGRLLVVQEGPPQASFGAEVVRRGVAAGFSLFRTAPRVLAARDVPTPFSPVLEDACIPQEADIASAAEQIFAG